jgi:hypothetical protein
MKMLPTVSKLKAEGMSSAALNMFETTGRLTSPCLSTFPSPISMTTEARQVILSPLYQEYSKITCS